MERIGRSYSSLIALGVIVVIAIACLLSPRVLAVAHHYVNFIAIGRSSVKITVLCIYAFLIFGASFVRIPLAVEKLKKLYALTLYVVLALTLISTAGMATLIAKFHVPLRTTFYAVTDHEFSFGHLTHSHLYRPVGYLLRYFTHVEVGTAWFHVLEQFFGIPSWALVVFYVGIGLIAVWFVFISIAYARAHRGIALTLVYLIASIAVIKSLVDGAFLDMTALIGIVTLGILLRNRFLIFLPLPFLVLDYFLWFTPDYLAQAAITVALLLGLALIHYAGQLQKYHKVLPLFAAFLCFGFFVYAGARIPFFGADVQEEVAALPTSDTHVIPANADVYFTPQGDSWPLRVTTTEAEPLATFVKEHNVYYENYKDSIKIEGTSCNIHSSIRILDRVRIFAPSGNSPSLSEAAPWILEEKSQEGYTLLRINGCLTNTLPSIVRIIKTLFPDTVIVFAFTP